MNCPACDRPMATYVRAFSKRLAAALAYFWAFNGNIQSRVVDAQFRPLSWEWLRLWRLIEKNPTKRGEWHITQRGRDFVNGKLSIPITVSVRNGEVVDQSAITMTYQSALTLEPKRNPRRRDERKQEQAAA